MPQLDFVTYFNQYFFLMVFLSICLIMMLNSILPNTKASISSSFFNFSYIKITNNSEKFKNLKKLLLN